MTTPHPFKAPSLSEILASRGFASAAHVAIATLESEEELGAHLVRNAVITDVQLAQALGEKFALPYVDLAGHTVAPGLFEHFAAVWAYQLGVVPYRLDGDILEVAIANPYDLALPDQIERLSERRVRLLITTSAAIQAALKRSQGAAEVLKGISEDFRFLMVKEGEDGGEQTVSLERVGDGSSPVVRLVNTLLLDALAKRVSDVHIETYEMGLSVKYRVDGVLYPAMETIDRRHHGALVARLKVMAELDIAERRVPQDGRFKLRLNSRDIDFRMSVIPSIFGEDVVIRILDKSAISEGFHGLRLEHLGFAPELLRRFRRAVHEPYGMVLITGPTGSGKTTTLYAALSELDSSEEKVITIEDPIEYRLEGIVQIPVNEKKGLTFARGLRSILRHDPDKIMVGEIRDSETAQIAVQSALTGHLVFTTVHANNAFDVIGRFSHMGLDVYSFVAGLNCVMAQRLVRLICPRCKREVRAGDELLEDSGLDPGRHTDTVWYEGSGCEYCNGTGYRGRGAIAEFLQLSPRVRQMIIERRSAADLQSAAVEEGMVTLRQAAIAKALAGETTLREINRVTFVE